MSKHENRSRRAGRRGGNAGKVNRQAILDAAREHFAQHGFRATTLRAIADSADVTPAMLHYHFGSKSGLYFAVIETVAEPLLRELTMLRHQDNARERLRDFISLYMRTISAHPEIPSLLMHDVLAADGAMRSGFAARFASRGREAISSLLRKAQADGEIPADVDIDLGVISLLSLAIFPFLAAPLIREVFDREWQGEQLEALIHHQQALFIAGMTHRNGEKS